MKRGLLITTAFLLMIILVTAGVLASEVGRFTISVTQEDAVEDLKAKVDWNNPLMENIFSWGGVYIFGIYNMEAMSESYSTTTIIILFFLIWLILFVGISDIISLTGYFTTWVAWVMGFAITVIAANVGAVQVFSYWIVLALGFLGAFAIFLAIFGAFITFIALSWGAKWAYEHRARIAASKGRTDIVAGMQTAAAMGEASKKKTKIPFLGG